MEWGRIHRRSWETATVISSGIGVTYTVPSNETLPQCFGDAPRQCWWSSCGAITDVNAGDPSRIVVGVSCRGVEPRPQATA